MFMVLEFGYSASELLLHKETSSNNFNTFIVYNGRNAVIFSVRSALASPHTIALPHTINVPGTSTKSKKVGRQHGQVSLCALLTSVKQPNLFRGTDSARPRVPQRISFTKSRAIKQSWFGA